MRNLRRRRLRGRLELGIRRLRDTDNQRDTRSRAGCRLEDRNKVRIIMEQLLHSNRGMDSQGCSRKVGHKDRALTLACRKGQLKMGGILVHRSKHRINLGSARGNLERRMLKAATQRRGSNRHNSLISL